MTDQSESQSSAGAEWNIPQMGTEQSERWHEFFSIPTMSMGIYKLKTGDTDLQSPHTEDEAYYIVSGKAKIQVEDEVYNCVAGKVIFVRRHASHKFIDIEEDLTILVFFAPAEGSQVE
jgi:mannose-6-phosphate isomerase-like protein (cupin superfamily)